MPDGEFIVIAILQIGNQLVIIFNPAIAKIGTGNEAVTIVDGELGLEDIACIFFSVGCRATMIDQENRNCSSTSR